MPDSRAKGGVLFAEKEFGNTEEHKIRFPDRSLIQYPCGIHTCDYDEEKYKKRKDRAQVFNEAALSIPRNNLSFNLWYRVCVRMLSYCCV